MTSSGLFFFLLTHVDDVITLILLCDVKQKQADSKPQRVSGHRAAAADLCPETLSQRFSAPAEHYGLGLGLVLLLTSRLLSGLKQRVA